MSRDYGVVVPSDEDLVEARISWDMGKMMGFKISNDLAMVAALAVGVPRSCCSVVGRVLRLMVASLVLFVALVLHPLLWCFALLYWCSCQLSSSLLVVVCVVRCWGALCVGVFRRSGLVCLGSCGVSVAIIFLVLAFLLLCSGSVFVFWLPSLKWLSNLLIIKKKKKILTYNW